MSQQDYDAGRRGDTFQQGMNQISYEAGLAKYKKEQDSQTPVGPKTEVDGAGFTMILMGPLLALMYPVAGSIAIGSVLAVNVMISLLMPKASILRFIASIVVLLWSLSLFGQKAEQAASRIKIYRQFRHIFRLLPVGILVFTAMTRTYSGRSAEAAGAAIFAGLVVMALMHWIFPKFDRLWFPVMDDKAVKEEKKYRGMEDEQIWNSKNFDWRNKKRFFAIWLAGTVALCIPFHKGVPFILLAGISYVLCLKFKKFFEIKKGEQVTPSFSPGKEASFSDGKKEEPPVPAEV